jgi:hypothetical protein
MASDDWRELPLESSCKLLVKLPPLAEQRNIARVLGVLETDEYVLESNTSPRRSRMRFNLISAALVRNSSLF